MRIKKYENWKLNHTQYVQTENPHHKNSDIFSVSQLLEASHRSAHSQHEYKYILTNPHITNISLNRRTLKTMKRVSNITNQMQKKTERQQNIKNKIKQRIKQELLCQNFHVNTHRTFFYKNTNNNDENILGSVSSIIPQSSEFPVYVRGCSVPFNSFSQKKRSKSTVIRSNLTSSSKRKSLQKNQKTREQQIEIIPLKSFPEHEVKRHKSSNLPNRQKIITYVKKAKQIHHIDPWQIEDCEYINMTIQNKINEKSKKQSNLKNEQNQEQF